MGRIVDRRAVGQAGTIEGLLQKTASLTTTLADRDQLIGNVIDSLFLVQLDYPAAAACSVVLMLAIAVMVLVYVRRAGTEELL